MCLQSVSRKPEALVEKNCNCCRSKGMCSFDLRDFFRDIRNRPSSGNEQVSEDQPFLLTVGH